MRQNSEYIYRYNEEGFKCAKAVVETGEFTKELRDKYYGFFVEDSTSPFLAGGSKDGTSYQIYFGANWKITSIWQSTQYRLIGSGFDNWFISLIGYTLGSEKDYGYTGELKQLDKGYRPMYNEQNEYMGMYLRHESLHIDVDMGDGRFASCSVDATYNLDKKTENFWNGQEQKHEYLTYLSMC